MPLLLKQRSNSKRMYSYIVHGKTVGLRPAATFSCAGLVQSIAAPQPFHNGHDRLSAFLQQCSLMIYPATTFCFVQFRDLPGLYQSVFPQGPGLTTTHPIVATQSKSRLVQVREWPITLATDALRPARTPSIINER